MAVSRMSIIKFVELALACICIGLHYHSFGGGDMHTQMLSTGTFCGYVIILIGGFAGYLMNTPINRRIDIFFSLVGCALFVASGALIIEAWQNGYRSETRNIALSKGSVAIINGAVFLVDSILTFRGE